MTIEIKAAAHDIDTIEHEDFVDKLKDKSYAEKMLDSVIVHGYENFWKLVSESRE